MSERAEHTPGPWRVDAEPTDLTPGEIAAPAAPGQILHTWLRDDGRLRSIANVSTDPWMEAKEATANARLIAAAPDLLEACKAAFVALPMAKHNESVNAMLKAAIAKAEGRDG